MRIRATSFVAAAFTLLLAHGASATTIVLPTDEQLVDKSPVIVAGTVLKTGPVERNGGIWTETSISVDTQLKGSVGSRVVVREIGGIVGERVTMVFGSPQYRAGERVLAFLTPTSRGDYQTVDLLVGKFTEGKTLDGQRLWLRNVHERNVTILDGTLEPASIPDTQRSADAFERFIRERRDGRSSTESYTVANPVLAGSLRSSAPGLEAQPDFTLIAEPTVYRWTGFDSNVSATWFSTGTQSGYSGGGTNELRTAMAAWTSYGSAKILYTYSGQRTAAPGGMDSPNGVNEVMFEDPLGDIAGAWSPSTGGVVGQGGFNGVTNGGSWTAPFAADAAHPQRSYSTYRIVEGNLVIQNGVSPANGLPSARLAEILAHEFGHTLGFGHSSESDSEPNTTLSGALMYFRVTGLGPSLRADDQLAARWLYPNGGGGSVPPPPPTVPAAPGNLTATSSGTTVSLIWTDNSDNETGFGINAATGTSSTFSRVADVAANARAVTLTGFTPGTYRFNVVAFNATGSSAASNTVTVTITAQLQAAFSVSPSLSGIAGTTLFTFTDDSSGTVLSRLWQFGDGQTSSAASPTHTYSTAGTYTVTLIVNGSGGLQSQTSKNISITNPVTPLVADFEWSPASPLAGDNVAFSDRSTGGVTSWQWNFGDGTSSSQQNPVKRYTNAATYAVTLVVYRGTESRVVSKNIAVVAQLPANPVVAASFTWTPSPAAVGANVTFTDTSTGSPTSWQWNFGNGATSTVRNPVYAFPAAGLYSVTLVASNGSSSSSVTRQVTVGAGAEIYRTLVSAAAQTEGVGGSNWRTELSLFNAGGATSNVQLTYLPGAGGTTQSRAVTLLPGRAIAYANALPEIFGLSSGAGAISITASSSLPVDLRVASRTFTGASATYGQDVPAVGESDLAASVYLVGIEASSAFRTNIGLVNSAGAPASVALSLLDQDGSTIGSANVALPASSFQQSALTALIPSAASAARSSMTLRVTSSVAGSVSAYASVVDNRTQDPVFIQGAPAISGTSMIVPVVGRAAGANGTFWRSDVAFHNPRPESLGLTLRYIPAGTDGRGAATRNVLIAGGRTNTLADILSTFSLTSGSGALEVTWSGGTGPVIMSRTYTSTEAGGTYGQSIAPVSSYAQTSYVTGIRNDASFRSNIGLVNAAAAATGVNLTLLGANGETIATAFVDLAPKTQRQFALRDLFGALPDGRFTLVAAATSSAQLFAYGSVVDNVSGDPVFYAGR